MQIGEKSFSSLINFNYRVVDDGFCDDLIKYYRCKGERKAFESHIGGKTKKEWRLDKNYRDSKELVPWGGDFIPKIRAVINPMVEEYIRQYPEVHQPFKDSWYEPAHLLHYEPNQGHYNFHSDDWGDSSRILSIIIYLNNRIKEIEDKMDQEWM